MAAGARGRPALAAVAVAALCGASLPGQAVGREVADKTPTPCKAKYDTDTVAALAEKYVVGIPTGQAVPHLLLLLGGSGAGKGTLMKHLAKHGFPAKDYVRHGLDDYLELLPEWQQTAADTAHVYKDAADGCYGGAIPVAKAAQELLLQRKMHAVYEETGKNLDRVLKRVIAPFKDAGYRVTIALVDSTPELAKGRAELRFQAEGRYSSPDYVESTFKNVFENYLVLREKDFIAESVYCDNGCSELACMRCWDDSAVAPEQRVVTEGALQQGKVEYMKGRAVKSVRDEV